MKKKILGIAIPLLLAAAVAAAGLFFYNESAKQELHKNFARNWYMPEEDGCRTVLNISDRRISHRFETDISWIRTTLGDYDYFVTGRDTVQINYLGVRYKEFKVTFSDDGETMFVSPSITDDAERQTWFLD